MFAFIVLFFFSSRRRHTRWTGDWSSDVCSSDLKMHTGQIVEHQRDALGKALLVELLLDADPVSVQLIHGGIQVVLVEVFGGLIQATGRGQQGAASVIDQGQFGAGKQNTTQGHGLEQTGHPSIRNEVKDRAQAKLFPGLVQDHQPAAIPGFAQLQRLCSHKAASLKGLADELAGLRGQRRDIADGAGARALWGTKGLANQVGEVGDAAVLAFGDLHEHTCYIEAHIFINASQILTNLDLLLATFLTEILVSQRFSHFEREVRLTENSKSNNSFLWRQLTASGPSPNTYFLSPGCPQHYFRPSSTPRHTPRSRSELIGDPSPVQLRLGEQPAASAVTVRQPEVTDCNLI